jgi:hypothetical protein
MTRARTSGPGSLSDVVELERQALSPMGQLTPVPPSPQ